MKKIRKPIITVLGHVDAGKTSLLDAIRGTAFAEKEAGLITQHIGATEVPIAIVDRLSGELLEKYKFKLVIPGLLFIDTPGHEAFTNLRHRGGSIADLAVLVVDVMQGCQPQTFEAIDILRSFKVPFVIALNKIDLLHEWDSKKQGVSKSLVEQGPRAIEELDNRLYTVVGQVHSRNFVSERFDRVADFTKQVPIIPVSTKTGEGLPELLMFLGGLSQKYLEKELSIEESGPGKGVILDVKEERGLGTTVDVILYEGEIKAGDKIVLGGRQGAIETKVRALLQPKPLVDMRMAQDKFNRLEEIHAASGVKISAPGLETAIPGSPLMVVSTGKEIDEIRQELSSIEFETDAIGPIVRADTLGSLEAISRMLEQKGIKAKKTDIGDVTKKDVIEAVTVREKDSLKGVIIAFHVNVPKEIEEEIEKNKVKLFKEAVIYRIFEDYDRWVEASRQEEKALKLKQVVFPAKVQLLPNYVFRHSKPAIVGVKVLEGRLKKNVELINENR
ncbi:translation initiation factor IF-2, partial [archaeon]|nr:translation initiation factor IF-2 [archaeon]